MMVKIFLLCINYFIIVNGIIYDCTTNDTVYLMTEEVAFFETNNYPNLMKSNDSDNCNLRFALNKNIYTTNVHPRVYVVFTEITVTESKKTVIIKDSLSFSLYSNFKNQSVAQQGFIIFDGWRNSCPLESVSREEPFKMHDDSEILYIQSTYNLNTFYRTSPCLWKFSAPPGFGFKFVVETWNASNLTLLSVTNKSGTITNEIGLKKFHSYYNPDQFMQISLTKGHTDKPQKMEFQAYVTLVRKEFQNTDAKCFNFTNGVETLWTMNRTKGYGRNVKCSYLLIIPPQTNILVNIKTMVVEKGVDFIRYFPEGSFKNYTYFYSPTIFIIEGIENESDEKRFIWEFITDGSFQTSGFEVAFTETNLTSLPSTPTNEFDSTSNPANENTQTSPTFIASTTSVIPVMYEHLVHQSPLILILIFSTIILFYCCIRYSFLALSCKKMFCK